MDQHFGSEVWQERLTQYIVSSDNIAVTLTNEPFPRVTDVFGTVWKTDELPKVVLEPALKDPGFQDYSFPTVERLLDHDIISRAKKLAAESESFVVIRAGVSLWWTWYLRGFEQTLMDCIAEEEFYEELLDRMMHLTLEVIDACADIPADAIMMGDDWGSQRGVLIGPDRWRRFFRPRYARIFDAVHKHGKIAIMHCCGSVADIMSDIIEIGLDVLESVQPEAADMNPYELKKKWGDRITFWGGLGSQSTIPFSTPEEIRLEIQNLRREMGKGGGYILAPAKPIRSETPTENVLAVIEEFLSG
ncbi:MAG: hypothetical protein JSV89_21690 [Spirochaetaceae bacterium]|nr:MAG: hypothetical protein JSV89_21690 [Spirochaetaceae bacterium]